MKTKRCRTISSPIGPLVLAGENGVLTNLRMDGQAHAPDGQAGWTEDTAIFDEAVEQLDAYFAGDLKQFDLEMRLDGTAFQRRVWAGLCDVAYGDTWSYGQLAGHVGVPGSARAVGWVNGRNPVAIIVPCHRVIGASGALTGYGGGLARKKALLDLEQGVRPLPAGSGEA
jgi:methylated-DNA-[protein]-cysteine S-methyltransferase